MASSTTIEIKMGNIYMASSTTIEIKMGFDCVAWSACGALTASLSFPAALWLRRFVCLRPASPGLPAALWLRRLVCLRRFDCVAWSALHSIKLFSLRCPCETKLKWAIYLTLHWHCNKYYNYIIDYHIFIIFNLF